MRYYDCMDENAESEFYSFKYELYKTITSCEVRNYLDTQPRDKKIGYIFIKKYQNIADPMCTYSSKIMGLKVVVENDSFTYFDTSEYKNKTVKIVDFLKEHIYSQGLKSTIEEKIKTHKKIVTTDCVHSSRKLVCFAFIPRSEIDNIDPDYNYFHEICDN